MLTSLRGDHTRLGYALQLATVRCLGTFRSDPTDVPPVLVSTIAQQLTITPTDHLARYQASRMRWFHTVDIRQRYGYVDYTDPLRGWRFARWLFARAWLGTERPSLLFERAVGWLCAPKRYCFQASACSNAMSPACATGPANGSGASSPTISPPPNVSNWKPCCVLLPALPAYLSLSRLHALARSALTLRAQTLSRMATPRRLAMLRAALHARLAGAAQRAAGAADPAPAA